MSEIKKFKQFKVWRKSWNDGKGYDESLGKSNVSKYYTMTVVDERGGYWILEDGKRARIDERNIVKERENQPTRTDNQNNSNKKPPFKIWRKSWNDGKGYDESLGKGNVSKSYTATVVEVKDGYWILEDGKRARIDERNIVKEVERQPQKQTREQHSNQETQSDTNISVDQFSVPSTPSTPSNEKVKPKKNKGEVLDI